MATPFHSACPGIHCTKLLCPGSSSHVHSGIASVPEVHCTRVNLSATEVYVLSRKYTNNVRWEIISYPLLNAIELQ